MADQIIESSTHGCYNVFYDHHLDTEGDLVHHVALEPRGEWHLPKRQQESGPEHNTDGNFETDDMTPFFSDYSFYDFTESVEDTFGAQPSAEDLDKDFLRGTYNNQKGLSQAG
jgi:hypothetical protein